MRARRHGRRPLRPARPHHPQRGRAYPAPASRSAHVPRRERCQRRTGADLHLARRGHRRLRPRAAGAITVAGSSANRPSTANRKAKLLNFRRADWTSFTIELDQLVSRLPAPTEADSGEKPFREAVLRASRHHIPTGRRKFYRPGLTPQVRQLITARARQREKAQPQRCKDHRNERDNQQVDRI